MLPSKQHTRMGHGRAEQLSGPVSQCVTVRPAWSTRHLLGKLAKLLPRKVWHWKSPVDSFPARALWQHNHLGGAP